MTSSIQFHAFDAGHQSAGLKNSSLGSKGLTSDSFQDHVSQSRENEPETRLIGKGGLAGGDCEAQAEIPDRASDKSAVAPKTESAAKLDDDENGAAGSINPQVEVRAEAVDFGLRTSPSDGMDSKVSPEMGELSGVGISGGAGSNALEPNRSTGEVTVSEGLRSAGSAPLGFSTADARANPPRADETTKTESGGMRREILQLTQFASGVSHLSGPPSAVSRPGTSEHPDAIGRDTTQQSGSLATPSTPGQPHPSMAGARQFLHNPDRFFVREQPKENQVQANELGSSPVTRQQTAMFASTLLAHGTNHTIPMNLNALTSMQGKQEHQLLANNFRMADGLVLEPSQTLTLPPIENTASLSGPLMAAPHPFNLISGASLVGVGGLNPVQPAMSQVLNAIGKSTNGAIIVALNPRELGRVRMSMTASETGFVVSIIAERAETLDIMRRHSDALMDEFRRFGFESPDLEFSHGGSNFNPGSDGVTVMSNAEAEPEQLSPAPQNTRSRPRETTGLDMRI